MRAAKHNHVSPLREQGVDDVFDVRFVERILLDALGPVAAIGFKDGERLAIRGFERVISLAGKRGWRGAHSNNARGRGGAGGFYHRFDANKFLRWVTAAQVVDGVCGGGVAGKDNDVTALLQ